MSAVRLGHGVFRKPSRLSKGKPRYRATVKQVQEAKWLRFKPGCVSFHSTYSSYRPLLVNCLEISWTWRFRVGRSRAGRAACWRRGCWPAGRAPGNGRRPHRPECRVCLRLTPLLHPPALGAPRVFVRLSRIRVTRPELGTVFQFNSRMF